VLDLERRGLSPRFAFVALATLEAVPAMVERAGVIQASQRARGLDTEGSVVARLRGVLPLVGPVILSSLTEVEERTLALEVRAFGRPGRRHLLWHVPDSTAQLLVRSALLLGFLVLVGLKVAGLLPPTI
jgi:energy-coupling factor transport system permease protein